MTADPRITVSYMLSHPPSEPAVVRDVIEKMRQRAIALGFFRVSELVVLTTKEAILGSEFGNHPIRPEAAISFAGSLFDSEAVEFGLCKPPEQIEVGGEAIPYGVADWTWNAVVRTRDVRTLSELFTFAAENGLWTSMSFAGTTISCFRGASGALEYKQEWVEILDDDDF